MEDNKLEKLKKIAQIFNSESVSKKEMADLMASLIKTIKEINFGFKKDIKDTEEEFLSLMKKAFKDNVEIVDEKLNRFIDLNNKLTNNKIKTFDTSLIDLKDNIRQEFNLNLESVLKDIKDIRRCMPEMPEMKEETPEETREKLESLKGNNRLKIDAIDDLREELDRLKKARKVPFLSVGGGIASRDLFQDIDISSQLDGVTKTFNIRAVWNIISVDLSSFPYGALRKGTDYTWTPTSITFTDEIDASTQLASGQTCILTVVNA